MELVGICKQLTALREERGISPEEVSAATKIPITVLRKIESCEALASTPKVYLKGFLKLYAQYLHADDIYNRIDDAFTPAHDKKTTVREQTVPAPSARPVPQQAANRSQPATSHLIPQSPQLKVDTATHRESNPLGKPLIIGVIVFIAIAGVRTLASKKARPSATRPPVTAPERKHPASGNAERSVPSAASTTPAPVTSPSAPVATSTEETAPALTPLPGIENVENVFVDVITTDNIFVSVQTDGELVFKSLLLKGARETWSANGMIEIRISNPSVVRLEILGKQIPTDNRNKPTTYVITPEGFYTKK